ncbi:MAG: hypothetical protein JNK29_06300 [Anaerolineales bacterium]|nr:hypothetical protein [Anaerolineales bacterium]
MPRLSAWLVRIALAYLAAGFLLGALLLLNKGLPFSGGLWRWLPVHIEFLLLGWTAQFALGVAYWILPRFHSERRREAWAALAGGLLNAGLLLVCAASLLGWGGAWLTAGRLLEAGAALAFAWHAWPRVKPMSV